MPLTVEALRHKLCAAIGAKGKLALINKATRATVLALDFFHGASLLMKPQ